MTLDYCFQTLRVRPAEAVMLDQSEGADAQLPQLSVPMRLTSSPSLAGVPQAILEEYLAPLAAALHYSKSARVGDILPADYGAYSKNRMILSAGSIAMFVCTLLLAGYALTQFMIVSDLKSGIGTLKSQLATSREELAAYRKLEDEVKNLSKPLEILNKQRSSIHPAMALAALTLPGSPDYFIKGISVQDGEGFLNVQIDGSIVANGFSNVQATFEWIIEQLGKIPGYAVVASSVDIKQKNFKIQARYNGVAKKGT
jgi:hypothetical protein